MGEIVGNPRCLAENEYVLLDLPETAHHDQTFGFVTVFSCKLLAVRQPSLCLYVHSASCTSCVSRLVYLHVYRPYAIAQTTKPQTDAAAVSLQK